MEILNECKAYLKAIWEQNAPWVLLIWCGVLTGWLATLTTYVMESTK